MFRCGPTLLCGPASFFIRANVMNSIDPFGGRGSASRAGPLDNGGSLFIYRGIRADTTDRLPFIQVPFDFADDGLCSVNIGIRARIVVARGSTDRRRENALVARSREREEGESEVVGENNARVNIYHAGGRAKVNLFTDAHSIRPRR